MFRDNGGGSNAVLEPGFSPFGTGGFGVEGEAGSAFGASVVPAVAFDAPLLTTIVPRKAAGSATFTRATVATIIDWEGIIRSVLSGEARFYGARRVRNLVATSSVAWAAGSGFVTVTNNYAAAPDGTTTAARLEYTGVVTQAYVVISPTPASGDPLVYSIYMKSNTGASQTISITTISGTNNVTVTTSWQRFSVSETSNGNNTADVLGSSGNDILVWGAQVENTTGQTNTNPSEYVSVGVLSAPYHGTNVDGVKCFAYQNGNSVASNVVTEAQGAAIGSSTLLGYLAEGQIQNRCLYSSDFTNAAWVSGGGGITVGGSAAGPDGVTYTTITLTASGANGTLIQDLGVVGSAAKTGSVWLKRKTGTGNIDLTMDGGSTWTTKTITSSWARYSVTQTLANEDFGIRIVTSGDEVYAAFAQVETQSFATSNIATTSGAVTRNADVLTYPAGNMSDTAGTAYAEISSEWSTNVGTGYVVATTANGRMIYQANTNGTTDIRVYDGTTVGVSAAGTSFLNATQKAASVWGRSGKEAAFFNGAKGTEQNYDGTMAAGSFGVGCIAAGTKQWYGTIRNVKIWTSALVDAQIAALGL